MTRLLTGEAPIVAPHASTPMGTAAGIVADDLTGAADSAVQFARAGWLARLALGDGAPAAAREGSVVALVTDARALDDEAAAAASASAVRVLAGSGTDRVLVKIDSTMRGSVAAQVRGALAAWRERHPSAMAVVAPAYPALGRTVIGGRLLVDGVGVDETAVGRDPVTPVGTAEMSELLPGSTGTVVDGADGPGLAGRLAALGDAGADVVVVDTATDDDLVVVAEAVDLLGARAVPAGSAGLAVPMAHAWGAGAAEPADVASGPTRHVVVVLSSLHDSSRAQHDHLLGHRRDVRTVAPTLAEVLAGDLAPALGRADDADGASVTVVLAPARGDDDPVAARVAQEVLGTPPGGTVPQLVADALATLTEHVVDGLVPDALALVLVGGEGARSVLRRVRADAVVVHGALREGVPWGTLEGGSLHGTPVVTKAGGFGPASTISDVVHDLFDHHHRPAPQGDPS